MPLQWEPTSVKAQLRFTSQKLGQLQEKKDSQSHITRKDIATLLRQGNFWLARAKAQNLILDDALGDLLEHLELHIGILLEHFTELDLRSSMTPVVTEAAASLIYAAPHVESKGTSHLPLAQGAIVNIITDLQVVCSLLAYHLGPEFTNSAITNQNNCVSAVVIRVLTSPSPSAPMVDTCLQKTAQSHGVEWAPELSRHEAVNFLSEIMAPEASPVIDLAQLRIPEEPRWLRPRIWKLFFGILPPTKSSWNEQAKKQRENYYDLVQRLLEPFSKLGDPTTPLSSQDATLLDISKQLTRIPINLFDDLKHVPPAMPSCPLDANASSNIKLSCASNLDDRLQVLQADKQSSSQTIDMPEIRLEVMDTQENEPNDGSQSSDHNTQRTQTTILSPSRSFIPNIPPKHSSSLLRILYLHAIINPGILSPHIPSLLIPLYSVLTQEIEPEDAAHTEADTFWLFEAMVGEFSDFEDEEAAKLWMNKFGERLAWADRDLYDMLCDQGLDPALPHYSYRWLATVLTHTLPLSSVIPVWDALFSYSMRSRDRNHKMEYLIDICTSMLMCARSKLLRLGTHATQYRTLWSTPLGSPRVLGTFLETGDTFMEGMSFLQHYPAAFAGGIDRILQSAHDLSQYQHAHKEDIGETKLGLGARIRTTMWKGFTNQMPSPEKSPVQSDDEGKGGPDDGNETETPSGRLGPSLTSRLATTVWKGITNQTSMEPPPSPLTPITPEDSRPSSPLLESVKHEASNGSPSPSNSYSSIWSYAEKLKDSDAAATLAKVSSNWKARALMTSWSRKSDSQEAPKSPPVTLQPVKSSPSLSTIELGQKQHRSSPSSTQSSPYSPPPRPAFFRPPRDSYILTDTEKSALPLPSDTSSPKLSPENGSFLNKTRSLQASLAALTGSSPQPTPKSAPRPLLLGSNPIVSSSPRLRPTTRSPNSAPTPDRDEWVDVSEAQKYRMHRDSLSSVSSLSLSEAFGRQLKSDRDSDTSALSKKIPLNRKSISPLAPNFRSQRPQHPSRPSSNASSEAGTPSTHPYRGGLQHNGPSDVPGLMSPPESRLSAPRRSPSEDGSQLAYEENQHDSVDLTNTVEEVSPSTVTLKRSIRKKAPTLHDQPGDTSDSSIANKHPSRSARVRTKRYQPRLASLTTQGETLPPPSSDHKLPSPNSLSVEWPSEDQDLSSTPTAASFDVNCQRSASPKAGKRSQRKLSSDGREARIRKVSNGQRTRKVSSEAKELARRSRDSAAEEGDDEGYDDLLSAYESEEGIQVNQ
ncbi:hypothetical protein AMATHDRAFT_3758 [Amanita thiersii Skay4041]|uniref:Rab-GAP TBC domain-containing protein n=1 Tax=Amanita thiersii Skay4041 TaxID=703135 RepID=A0A2A9NSM6_9AGAR|nr:hypothetical protein AMATHDRAFT_3758 [Amanita thiersii Skay4041]